MRGDREGKEKGENNNIERCDLQCCEDNMVSPFTSLFSPNQKKGEYVATRKEI